MNLLQSAQSTASKIEVDIIKVEEAELDEMWSYVGKKDNQRWLWHAIDDNTHEILAYCFGTRKDKVFRELKEKLSKFDEALPCFQTNSTSNSLKIKRLY